ncbi:conserved exported hypothetical protein [Rhodococcus sp. RD6.2]|jgi:hypothetical protein|uniref:hypothetical protein n=1 Tax=unclassified Rhodococcus (in: high G+C Gram-positive bacteria) TaxID=192944 RepID=UPI00063B8DA3|nr:MULTISPECIES: hypothetical protein [unclassified Rhodococcus (in: high G+C Gram-positive bacteria)]CRK49928.1 conserved exported hypothetical protein [Rhodococcus sp. RD6.2]
MATNPPPAKKILGTVVFLVGLVGAGVGIYTLDVVAAVVWLVVATLSGFYLLKLRADSRSRLDSST